MPIVAIELLDYNKKHSRQLSILVSKIFLIDGDCSFFLLAVALYL